MSGVERECPHPGCGKPIERWRFACRPHWFMLPRPIRDAINVAYRAFTKEPSPESAASLDEAQEAARRHWEENA